MLACGADDTMGPAVPPDLTGTWSYVAPSLSGDYLGDPLTCDYELSMQIPQSGPMFTGRYSNARTEVERQAMLGELRMAAAAGREIGLRIHAGHGLDYKNVGPVARLDGVEELNIGHAIVARALLVGFERAVVEMRREIELAVTGLPPRGGA